MDQDATEIARLTDELLSAQPPATTPRRDFLDAQFDAGLAWVHFPIGLGGRGVDRRHQREVQVRLHEAGAPDAHAANPLGYSMGSAILLRWGTDAQIERYLRPLYVGDERWCQLFSEPGAGSDLAGVSTRATRTDDGWVVNGQKVWTSMATISDIGMLVARTDWDVPKHAGLTYFLLDMSSPGVDVRPLRQMTGDAEFNEVYLTDVRIPDTAVLGELGGGWQVAMATLSNERVAFGRPRVEQTPTETALELYRAAPDRDGELRGRMIETWIGDRVQRLSAARSAAARAAGTTGPDGSATKLQSTQLNQAAYELCLDLLGDESMLYDSWEMTTYSEQMLTDRTLPDVRRRFLRSRATTIEGGTSEILRNIIAERVLGLPPEQRPDKGVPFSRLTRS